MTDPTNPVVMTRFLFTPPRRNTRHEFVLLVLAFITTLQGFLIAQPIPSVVPPGTLYHDFDGDGVKERLLSSPGTNEIQRWVRESQSWVKADYALPEGVMLTDATGGDLGLRFVDLNGDGRDDILFSGPNRLEIHLWTKHVRPDLGWSRGTGCHHGHRH